MVCGLLCNLNPHQQLHRPIVVENVILHANHLFLQDQVSYRNIRTSLTCPHFSSSPSSALIMAWLPSAASKLMDMQCAVAIWVCVSITTIVPPVGCTVRWPISHGLLWSDLASSYQRNTPAGLADHAPHLTTPLICIYETVVFNKMCHTSILHECSSSLVSLSKLQNGCSIIINNYFGTRPFGIEGVKSE